MIGGPRRVGGGEWGGEGTSICHRGTRAREVGNGEKMGRQEGERDDGDEEREGRKGRAREGKTRQTWRKRSDEEKCLRTDWCTC